MVLDYQRDDAKLHSADFTTEWLHHKSPGALTEFPPK